MRAFFFGAGYHWASNGSKGKGDVIVRAPRVMVSGLSTVLVVSLTDLEPVHRSRCLQSLAH